MVDLAYILAASHSGSTLLAMLLNAHPDVATVGEMKCTNLGDVSRYRCSCGALIRECPFWTEVSRRMARRGIRFNVTSAGTSFHSGATRYTRRLLAPQHRGPELERLRDAALWLSPAWRSALPAIQTRNAALAETVREITGAKIIVDSSKNAVRLKYLLRYPELNVKVIRLIRDGRAVALTYTDPARYADARDPSLRQGGMGGDRRDQRLPLVRAAWEWRRNNEEAEHLLARLPDDHWIGLRYEDLCSDPDGQLWRILGFLGVDPAPRIPGFGSVEHHVLGNGMRLDADSKIQLDERWRDALGGGDLASFRSVAGALNKRHGYT